MKFLTSLSNWVFDGGGFNKAIYIDVLVEDALLTATPNLECSLYECAILQLYNMLLVDVSWELVDESMVVGRESVMSVKNALAILGKEWGKSRRFVLQFDTDVKGEGSAGRKEAYGAKSGANWALQILTTPTVNGSTYRLLEWLLVWVPKPSVKMRLRKDDSIQGFLWVSFPDAYVPYFPGDILLRDREATLNIQVIKVKLERATARMKNQGVAQVLVHWVHSSLADATWEFAEEVKACFPGFIGDDEALWGVICCKVKQREVNVSCEEEELVAEAKEEEKKCVPVKRNGHIRSEREAVGESEESLCLREEAMAKKVKRLVSVIPCGQGILRGMDCYDHKFIC